MTCGGSAVENIIEVTKGSCIDYTLTYTDENDAAEDITSDTLTVIDYYPAILANAVITKPDPANGVAAFHLEDNFAALLNMGAANYFRISRVTNAGHTDNTEIIRIDVR